MNLAKPALSFSANLPTLFSRLLSKAKDTYNNTLKPNLDFIFSKTQPEEKHSQKEKTKRSQSGNKKTHVYADTQLTTMNYNRLSNLRLDKSAFNSPQKSQLNTAHREEINKKLSTLNQKLKGTEQLLDKLKRMDLNYSKTPLDGFQSHLGQSALDSSLANLRKALQCTSSEKINLPINTSSINYDKTIQLAETAVTNATANASRATTALNSAEAVKRTQEIQIEAITHKKQISETPYPTIFNQTNKTKQQQSDSTKQTIYKSF